MWLRAVPVTLRFTYADPALATDIRSSFAMGGTHHYCKSCLSPASGFTSCCHQGVGRVARFAVDDPYAPLRQALTEMAQRLIDAGYRAEVLIDDNRLVDRAAAVRAGIVWQGKSSMALDPKHGPWIVLGSVVTDAPLQADVPMSRTCGTCDACIPACPTGAIVEPGVLDARLCLAAWAQTPGTIPVELPFGDGRSGVRVRRMSRRLSSWEPAPGNGERSSWNRRPRGGLGNGGRRTSVTVLTFLCAEE